MTLVFPLKGRRSPAMRRYGYDARSMLLSMYLFVSCLQTTSAAEYGEFVFPMSNPGTTMYNFNDVIILAWNSFITNPTLYLWGHDPPGQGRQNLFLYHQVNVLSNGTYPLSFIPKILDGTWTKFPIGMHLNMKPEAQTSAGQGFNGPYFVVTSDPGKAATTFAYQVPAGVTTSFSVPTQVPTASSVPAAIATPTGGPERTGPAFSTASAPPPPQETGDTSGLSTGAKAGIAVGAIVGALILLGVGVALFVVRRKRRKAQHAGTEVRTVSTPRFELPGSEELEASSATSGDSTRKTAPGYGPVEVHAQQARFEK